jgi:hypothetical protein
MIRLTAAQPGVPVHYAPAAAAVESNFSAAFPQVANRCVVADARSAAHECVVFLPLVAECVRVSARLPVSERLPVSALQSAAESAQAVALLLVGARLAAVVDGPAEPEAPCRVVFHGVQREVYCLVR